MVRWERSPRCEGLHCDHLPSARPPQRSSAPPCANPRGGWRMKSVTVRWKRLRQPRWTRSTTELRRPSKRQRWPRSRAHWTQRCRLRWNRRSSRMQPQVQPQRREQCDRSWFLLGRVGIARLTRAGRDGPLARTAPPGEAAPSARRGMTTWNVAPSVTAGASSVGLVDVTSRRRRIPASTYSRSTHQRPCDTGGRKCLRSWATSRR